jgi:hypothetical protein
MRLRLITVLSVAGLLLAACGGPSAGQATPAPKSTTAGTDSAATSSGAPACRAADMSALPAIPTPPPAGTVAVRVSLVNTGDYACTITGVPKVAIGGISAQPRNLTVTANGAGEPMVLVPGDQAFTVVASAMSADFKCAAGVAPTRPPVLLVGVPDNLVAMKMADGTNFTECGDAVTVSPWQAF